MKERDDAGQEVCTGTIIAELTWLRFKETVRGYNAVNSGTEEKSSLKSTGMNAMTNMVMTLTWASCSYAL